MTGVITAYQEHNPCFLRGAASFEKYVPPRKIVIHLLGTQTRFARALLDRRDKGLNAPKARGLPHYLIGEGNCGKMTAFQLLPLEWESDCCGEGELGSYDTGDMRAIQIAICRDRSNGYKFFRAAITMAVDLCVDLCERYHLNNTDIISHREAYAMWMADQSTQPDDYLAKYGYNMDMFRKWVRYRTESDEEFLPAQREEIYPHFVVCLEKNEYGKFEGEQAKYITLERAMKYCPRGFRIFNVDTGKLVYSRVIDPGVKVRVLKNIVYKQVRTFEVKHAEYEVLSVEGERVVIGYNGEQIAAVAKKNLELIE